jgi:hypothetical protein
LIEGKLALPEENGYRISKNWDFSQLKMTFGTASKFPFTTLQ